MWRRRKLTVMARHRYKSIPALLAAVEAAGVGDRAMSPGGVANKLGISRHAIYQRIERGLHEVWQSGSVVLVDPIPNREVNSRRERR